MACILIFVLQQLRQLSRLSQFCQLKNLDFNDKTLMALNPALVPGSEFQVSSVKFLIKGLILFSN